MGNSPINVTFPDEDDDCNGIAGLKSIPNPFRSIKILVDTEVLEIGSQASWQTARKSVLKSKSKFSGNATSVAGPSDASANSAGDVFARTARKWL